MMPTLGSAVILMGLISLMTLCRADPHLDDLWVNFKVKFSKKYTPEIDQLRREIWEENIAYIQKHNLETDIGEHSYTLGLSEYADLSWSEYRRYLLGARPQRANSSDHTSRLFEYRPSTKQADDIEVDWRTKGFVTPVKNQGQCGSCWAFSSTGSLEGQHFRVYGRLVSLSEQNLVDCTRKYGNAGCNGGWMDNAFKYVSDNNGIDTEKGYPYEAKDDNCRYSSGKRGASDRGKIDVRKGDEDALKEAVRQMGPISVGIDAAHRSFQLYKSGVYLEPNCSSTSSDHAVLVVGYGQEDNQPFWLVKNSWGTSWGMDGYIKMARNHNNMCAIATFASYPVV